MKCDLANRLRIVRADLYGERGGPELARRLDLPIRTWYNYESGVTVPGEVLLKFVELTSVEPLWLLHGRGPRFRTPPPLWSAPTANPAESVEVLLRAALQRLEQAHHPVPSWAEWLAQPEEAPAPTHAADPFSEPNRHRNPLLGFRPEDDLTNSDPNSSQPYWVLSSPDDPARERLTPSHGVRYRIALCEWFNARQEGRWMIVRDNAMDPIAPQGSFVVYSDAPEPLDDLLGKLVTAWRGSAAEAFGWLEPLDEDDSSASRADAEPLVRPYHLRTERNPHERHLKRSLQNAPSFKRITAARWPEADSDEEHPGVWTVRRILWVVESSGGSPPV